jgi:hypothetical protein
VSAFDDDGDKQVTVNYNSPGKRRHHFDDNNIDGETVEKREAGKGGKDPATVSFRTVVSE